MKIFFVIIPIVVIVFMVFAFVGFLSPKFRAKMLSRQMKSLKHMVDYSKDDMMEVSKKMSEIGIKTKNAVLNNNEDLLKENATKQAEINKDAVNITAKAIKDGLNNKKNFCKYCGESIDNDSVYCKKCGKKL